MTAPTSVASRSLTGLRSSPAARWRGLLGLGLLLALSCTACRHRPAPASREPTGVSTPVALDHHLQDEWQAVANAMAADPSSEAVDRAADALLKQHPPPPVAMAAWQAKAERAYAIGDDALAIAHAQAALAQANAAGSILPDEARRSLWLTVARIEVRGGDGLKGVEAAHAAEAIAPLTPLEVWSLRAVGWDRGGKAADATWAYAHWRALVDANSGDAAYAESRLRALLPGVSPGQLEALAQRSSEEQVRECLQRAARGALIDGAAAKARESGWQRACERQGARIGVVLPRSGRMSVLADIHLAAVTATITEMSSQGLVLNLAWEDAGSDVASAVAAATRLVAAGVDTIIVPPQRNQAQAVVQAVRGHVRIIAPTENLEGVQVTAAALADRVRALVLQAKRQGKNRLVVAVPDQSYGKLVLAYAEKSAAKVGLTVQAAVYPPQTTSFHQVLASAVTSVRGGAALLVGDAMARSELVIRQLRRDGIEPNSQSDQAPLVLATGEGLSTDLVSGRHAVFDGVWLAPAASHLLTNHRFAAEFTRQQGFAPDDQAHLIHDALLAAMAVDGAADGSPAPADEGAIGASDRAVQPVLLRVEHEQIVETQSET